MTDPTVNPLRETKIWFEKAVPEPGVKNFTTQLGVHVEEFAEMLEQLEPSDIEAGNALQDALIANRHLAEVLKRKGGLHIAADPDGPDAPLFLDSLCDQLVTAVGVAHMAGYDVLGGLDEVNRSNYSKFDPETNEPIFDENMKVTKGPAYSKADLIPFLGFTQSTREGETESKFE